MFLKSFAFQVGRLYVNKIFVISCFHVNLEIEKDKKSYKFEQLK